MSAIWAAFCRTPVGDCFNGDCSGYSEDDGNQSIWSLLPWLLGPCSFHALAAIVHLLFLLIWSAELLGKGFHNHLRPVTELNSDRERQGKCATHGVASRATAYFIVSIVLSAFLFLLNLSLGVLDLLSRWFTGGFNPPMHVEATTWILAAAWLALTITTNSTRVEKKETVPVLVRAWWMAAFILSLLSLFPNVSNYQKFHQFTSEAWLETASIPVTAFLFVIAALGKTGFSSSAEDAALKEPFLPGTTTSEETSASKGPGVTSYSTAGFFSRLSMSWINPLIAAGYKKRLDLEDIPLADPGNTSEYSYSKLKRNWDNQTEATKSPSLLLAIARSFGREGVFVGLLAITGSVAANVGPFLIEDFVEYLAGRRRFAYEGYVLVLAFGLAQIVETATERVYFQLMQFQAMHVRSSLTAFVYRKGLRLSSQARKGHTTGEIINYMSVDVQRIGDFCIYLPDAWAFPVQLTLALLILYKVVGLAALSALVASIIVMVGNMPLAKLQDSCNTKVMEAKDKRMKALTESLRSMRILKLQAWETQFLSKIEELRKVEFRHLRENQIVNSVMTLIFWTSPMLVSVATFGTCVLLGTPLTAGRILSALAAIRVLQVPIAQLPDVISMAAQTRVSLDRMQKFLVEEELQGDAVIRASPTPGQAGIAIEIDGADFKWDPSVEIPILQNINLQVKKGQRIAICGTVGCGKSSFLASIMGEIPRTTGMVKVSGTTAYVAQTAWIQSAKIEENILFGSPMDRRTYEEAIRVCALEKDIELFAFGDQTVIGEKGINMSGGQKQRIQLARAVYQDADIYLLDDPFSAVDAHTGSDLFQGCVLGVLSSKTVLYVTHQVEFLPAADLILVMRDGKIVQAGKYDDLLQAGTDFSVLVNAHNEAIDLMGASGYKKEVKDSEEAEEDVPEVQGAAQITRQLSRKGSVEEIAPEQNRRQLVQEEERASGNTSLATYWAYLTAVYKGGLIPFILLTQMTFQLLQIASNYWMAWAAPATAGQPQRVDSKTLIVVYCIIALGTAIFVAFRGVLLSVVGLLAAQKFFKNMLLAIFSAPMSFFDSTPTGRILARASSDQDTLDTYIIFIFSSFLLSSIQLLGIILVMSQVTWGIVLLFIPVTVACISLQRYYIQTARELKRLMETLKAPIIHHYGESVAGAVTIRGFGKEQQFLDTNLELYDKYARPLFHNFTATQWLMFRMEMMATCVFTFALFYALKNIGGMDPVLAGLAVTYGLQFNSTQTLCVWTFSNMENRIIAVERILQYTRVKSEAPLVVEDSRPSLEWPSQGTIELHGLQVRYNDHSPFVLHNVTCTFPGGEKIGIVGRTGSGKSTLVQTLFRMVEPSGGRIVIDGVDISKIGLHDLRHKLSIIPQDPTLFEGTMRSNLDPLQLYSEADLWEALDKCQLGDVVRAKAEKLDCPVTEDGENWSVGQRQLVCLGRALLKRTTILVLDEATASVDTATDGVIQRTIQREFAQCTVITVAHRIPTVIGSDRALVLTDGRIAEYNSPFKLLENKNSLFYKLVSEYSSRSKSVNDLTELEE